PARCLDSAVDVPRRRGEWGGMGAGRKRGSWGATRGSRGASKRAPTWLAAIAVAGPDRSRVTVGGWFGSGLGRRRFGMTRVRFGALALAVSVALTACWSNSNSQLFPSTTARGGTDA